ncbi:AAA family ATPase, partial [Campylobacter upsaliensis]|nr:AAA family ATPase [Campylobacter upsaliensis]
MISRILMKENLGFKEANLKLSEGLTVFSGLSGAGKSVLFKGILAAFGFGESEAKFVELELDDKLDLESFGIESESENVFKMLKEKSTKYFINNQSIAKKSLQSLSKSFIKYLSVKDNNEFSNEKFLTLLDALESAKNPKFNETKEKFEQIFKEYNENSLKLNRVLEEERRIEELKELAQTHIEKISKINPKSGEYEELLKLKKRLSKRDKIEEAWNKVGGIFEYEKAVLDALNLSEVDANFFNECFNELRIIAENQKMEELDFDIEALLDRISDLSYLIKRYESIEGALETLELKKKELEHYENLSFEKKELELLNRDLKEKLEKKAHILSEARVRNLGVL